MKKLVTGVFVAILFVFMALPVWAAEYEYDATLPRVVDNAGFLADSEEQALAQRIDQIIERYGFDVVLVTETGLGTGPEFDEYAYDFYDYGGYGVGSDYDGVLVLVTAEARVISGSGYGNTVYSGDNIAYVGSKIAPLFDAGSHYDGFDKFLDYTEQLVPDPGHYTYTGQPDGDSANQTEAPIEGGDVLARKFTQVAIVCAAVSLGVALIIVFIMKGKLDTARPQPLANAYIKPGSFRLTGQSDRFLYKNVSVAIRVDNTSRSGGHGGGSMHVGSSGRSHSSGRF